MCRPAAIGRQKTKSSTALSPHPCSSTSLQPDLSPRSQNWHRAPQPWMHGLTFSCWQSQHACNYSTQVNKTATMLATAAHNRTRPESVPRTTSTAVLPSTHIFPLFTYIERVCYCLRQQLKQLGWALLLLLLLCTLLQVALHALYCQPAHHGSCKDINTK